MQFKVLNEFYFIQKREKETIDASSTDQVYKVTLQELGMRS